MFPLCDLMHRVWDITTMFEPLSTSFYNSVSDAYKYLCLGFERKGVNYCQIYSVTLAVLSINI